MNNLGLRFKHGHTIKTVKSREYNSWQQAKARCSNPNLAAYKYYGGRGIAMCERWRASFSAFLEDMGPRPLNTSLDRVDNDGDYELANCKWSSRKEQMKNRTLKLQETAPE